MSGHLDLDLVRRLADGEPVTPASAPDLAVFTARCGAAGVPDDVVAELTGLYALADGLTDDDVVGFHPCADPVLFEWWADGELWLGQRHLTTTRWSAGLGYALGDAAGPSFGPDSEFGSLRALLASVLDARA